jgi:hypothetical protein
VSKRWCPEAMLPNFFVIGAPKAGTTSLHRYLAAHPDIHMSEPKELNYFDDPAWKSRRGWYESHFETDAPLRGEANPHYAHHPYFTGVPERIHSVVPDAKLIYVVRDPLERIRSHCVQLYEMGLGGPSPETLLLDFDREDNRAVCASRYATQIREYLRFFDPSQFLVIDQHELKNNRDSTMAQVFAFLGADPSSARLSFHEELNTRAQKYEFTRSGDLLWSRVLSPVGRAVLPIGVRNRVRGRTFQAMPRRRVSSPTLPEAVRSQLVAQLEPEVAWLREFTGKSFATWQV